MGIQIYSNILIYVPKIPRIPRKPNQYSMHILIIDALSKLNFKRSFPKTSAVMQSLNGLLFEGFTRVGKNSYPNVMALLSGETGGIWPEDLPNRTTMYFLDKERQPILPYILRDHGYLTFHMEDAQTMGDFNRKGVVGFKEQPADIYYRGPFLAIVWANLGLLRNSLIGASDCYACLQEKMQHKHQLPVIQDFIDMYKNTPSFAYVHLNEYSHNDLNMAKHYDDDLAKMIQYLNDSSALKDTFFMLMGDHGFQRSEPPFIFTKQGMTEMNMPAFYLVPPENFSIDQKEKYENLIKHSTALTSAFDVNQMMREILSLGTNKSLKDIFQGFEAHGKSLFATMNNRTCEEAEIPLEYCNCLDGVTSLNEKDQNLVNLGKSLLADLNTHLKNQKYCSKINLKDIKNASLKKFNSALLLVFHLYAHERGGIFEAHILCKGSDNNSCKIHLNRLDWYSKTSGCVPENLSSLNPYCICDE